MQNVRQLYRIHNMNCALMFCLSFKENSLKERQNIKHMGTFKIHKLFTIIVPTVS